MSLTLSTDVFCDQCGDWTPGTVGPRNGGREARTIARSRGWTFSKHKDLCPLCNGKAEMKLSGGDYIFRKVITTERP